MAPDDALGSADIRRYWQWALERMHPLNRIYASEVWFEHLLRMRPRRQFWVAVLRDKGGTPMGLAPIRGHTVPLLYDIASRTLVRSDVHTAYVLGSEPMVPSMPSLHQLLYAGILRAIPSLQSVYLEALPTDGVSYQAVAGENGFLPYVTGKRAWSWIEMGTSFDEYLKKMSSKTRSTLRKKVRDLGAINLTRVAVEDQVEWFLDRAIPVSKNSWQHRVIGQRLDPIAHLEKYRDLARLGLFRSYLLTRGEEPCAFLVGYQSGGVFQLVECGYDERLATFSPGTALLYLVLEDLFAHNPPARFNFGPGDAPYKRQFGNRTSEDASVYLFRRTLGNAFRRTSHRAFRLAGAVAKRVLRR